MNHIVHMISVGVYRIPENIYVHEPDVCKNLEHP